MIFSKQLIIRVHAIYYIIIKQKDLTQGPMNNQTEIKITKSQLQQLAKLITIQYQKIEDYVQIQATSIVEMFSAIMVVNQQQRLIQRQSFQSIIKSQAWQKCVAHHDHFDHLKQKQIEQLSNRDLKIVSRLIDFKNEYKQKLSHISKKYDALLEVIREQSLKQLSLTMKIKQLEQKLVQQKRINGELIIKIGKLSEKNQQIILKFKIQIQKLKQQVVIMKEQVVQWFNKQSKHNSNIIKTCIQKYTTYISKLSQTIKKLSLKYEQQQIKYNNQRAKQGRIIRQLIIDLSEAICFKKKESQNEQQWFTQYQKFKQTRKTIQIEQGESLRRQVYVAPKLSDHEQFIAKQKQYLKRFSTLSSS